jgi:hypothetical protein
MTSRISALYNDWQEFRPTKTQAFWAIVAAVAATLIGGFGFAGWMSAAKAERLASEAAQDARLELAVKVCVDDFMHAADVKNRLAKLKSTEFFRRSDVVATGGYATMPGEKEADSTVAARCAAALDEVPVAGAKS